MLRVIVFASICSLILSGCATQGEKIQDDNSELAIAAYLDDANCWGKAHDGTVRDYKACCLEAQRVREARQERVGFLGLFGSERP